MFEFVKNFYRTFVVFFSCEIPVEIPLTLFVIRGYNNTVEVYHEEKERF